MTMEQQQLERCPTSPNGVEDELLSFLGRYNALEPLKRSEQAEGRFKGPSSRASSCDSSDRSPALPRRRNSNKNDSPVGVRRTRSGRKVVVRREEQQRQRHARSNNKDRVRASLDEAASLHSPLPRTPKRRSAPGRTRSRSLSPRRISAPAISTTNNDNNLRGSIKVRSKAAAPASVSPAPRGRRNRQSPSPAKPVSLNSLFAKADKDNSLSRSRHSAANQSLSRSRHSIASSSGSLASSPATPYRKSRRSRKQDSTATTQRLSTAIGRSTRRTLSGFQETLALSILLDSDKNKDESKNGKNNDISSCPFTDDVDGDDDDDYDGETAAMDLFAGFEDQKKSDNRSSIDSSTLSDDELGEVSHLLADPAKLPLNIRW